jgi:hypothetical protein
MMRIKEIYKTLHEFTVAATGLEDSKVIFASGKAMVRLKKPFVTISASAFRDAGTPINKTISQSGEMHMTTSMLFTASFQSFSDIAFEAEELLSDLYINFSTELPANIFKGLMAKRRTLKHVSAIPIVLNEQTENRTILEVEMGYLKHTVTDAGLIEDVAIEGLMSSNEIQIKGKIT